MELTTDTIVGNSFPLLYTYYSAAKVLLCRGAHTSSFLYTRFLSVVNALADESRDYEEDAVHRPARNGHMCEARFCRPDARLELLTEVPTVACHLAATFWRGILLLMCPLVTEDHLRNAQKETEAFQAAAMLRGIEKLEIAVCCKLEDGSKEQRLAAFCRDRGMSVSFFEVESLTALVEAPLDVAEVHRAVLASEKDVRQSESAKSLNTSPVTIDDLALWVHGVRQRLTQSVAARLNSDGVEAGALAAQAIGDDQSKSDGLKRRSLADARLKKQKADCFLLLHEPLESLLLCNSAIDVYKGLNDLVGQASCCEIIAASILQWYESQKPNTIHGRIGQMASADSPTTPNSSFVIPPVVELAVRDALASRKGSAGLLQLLDRNSTTNTLTAALQEFVAFDQGSSTDRARPERAPRRSSVSMDRSAAAPSSSLSLMMGAASMRFREAAQLYARARSEHDVASLLANLSGAHLLGLAEDQGGAIEVINGVTDESLPFNTAVMTCVSLAAALVALKIGAQRKFAYIVHQAACRFSEHLATSNYSVEVAEVLRSAFQSALALTCSLQMPCILNAGPRAYIAGHLLRSSRDRQGEVFWAGVRELLVHLRAMIRMSEEDQLTGRSGRAPKRAATAASTSASSDDFLVGHIREAQLTYSPATTPIATWPALQITLLDKLRHMSESLKLPLHALWYSYASLLSLRGAFDAKSQIAAHRTLTGRECAVSRQIRVFPSKSSDEVGSREMPWLVPPALTCVTSGEADFCMKKLRSKVGSRVWSKRHKKTPRGSEDDCIRYLHYGGLSETPYMPLLISLTPRPTRRIEGVSLQGQRDDVQSLSRSRITLRSFDAEEEEKEDVSLNTFLYQPWAADCPTPASGQPITYWALDELNFVSVRVQNLFAIDILMDHCRVLSAGASAEIQPLTVSIPPTTPGTEVSFEALIMPKEVGLLHLVGLAYLVCRVNTRQYLLRDCAELHSALFDGEPPAYTSTHLDKLLQAASLTRVLVVPPLPLLRIDVEVNRDHQGHKPSLSGKGTHNIRGQPFICQVVDGESCTITLTLLNESLVCIDELQFVLSEDVTLSMTDDGKFRNSPVVDDARRAEASRTVFRHGTLHLSDLDLYGRLQSACMEWCGGEVVEASSCLDPEDAAQTLPGIPPREQRQFQLKLVVGNSLSRLLLRILYCQKNSRYLRDDAIVFHFESRGYVRVSPSPDADHILRKLFTSGKASGIIGLDVAVKGLEEDIDLHILPKVKSSSGSPAVHHIRYDAASFSGTHRLPFDASKLLRLALTVKLTQRTVEQQRRLLIQALKRHYLFAWSVPSGRSGIATPKDIYLEVAALQSLLSRTTSIMSMSGGQEVEDLRIWIQLSHAESGRDQQMQRSESLELPDDGYPAHIEIRLLAQTLRAQPVVLRSAYFSFLQSDGSMDCHGVLCGCRNSAASVVVPVRDAGDDAFCCHSVTYINTMRPEELRVTATAVAGSGRILRAPPVSLSFPAQDY